MRGRLLIGAVLATVLVALVVRHQDTPAPYRVDVVFDSAKGMVPGQLVKIAGARVGKVQAVDLVAGPAARISLTLDRRFAPFRTDASCRILPEGFISENYVECRPGTPGAAPLAAAPQTGVPTVPRSRTSVPVSLQDVLDIFSLPVDARVHALIDELGIGTAGRGADMNAVLRRANPALTQARSLLALLNRQQRQITGAVSDADAVLAAVARDRGAVRELVARSADLTQVTAAHDARLGEAVRRAPALLAAADRGLVAIDRTTRTGTPLLGDLRRAAPELTRLTHGLPAFTAAARPALTRLGAAARQNRSSLAAARPLATQLRRTTATLVPVAGALQQLATSLRDTGGVENVLRVVYALANVAAAHDSVSHELTFFANVSGACIASATAPGCSHAYSAPGNGAVPVNTQPATGVSAAKARSLLDYLLR